MVGADNNYGYGPVFRVQSLTDRLRAAIQEEEVRQADVVNAMEDAATVDLDGSQLVAQMTTVLQSAQLTPCRARWWGSFGDGRPTALTGVRSRTRTRTTWVPP